MKTIRWLECGQFMVRVHIPAKSFASNIRMTLVIFTGKKKYFI